MTEFRVVAILWNDACSYKDTELENIDDEEGVKRLSIGALRRDTEEYVLIQSDLNPNSMGFLNKCLKIPRKLIVKVYNLGSLEIAKIVERQGGEDPNE